MISALFIAAVLVTITVVVHVAGLATLLRSLTKVRAAPPTQTAPIAWLLLRILWCLILIHSSEISVWALFYLWSECLPDAESAFYFSGVTYVTIGYGDVLLPKPWRILGPVEGLTGILLSGLSAGLFFAVVSRIYVSRHDPKRK